MKHLKFKKLIFNLKLSPNDLITILSKRHYLGNNFEYISEQNQIFNNKFLLMKIRN